MSTPVRIVVMEGDGIGPEITAATMAVLGAADRVFKLGLAFTPVAIGLAALRAQGTTLPPAAVYAAKAADGVILGPVSHNDYPPLAQGGLNPSGELRKRLDLFANIRPARSRGGFPPRCGSPVDLVIARENTEGFYADRSMFLGSGEFMPTADLPLSVRKVTRAGSTRLAQRRRGARAGAGPAWLGARHRRAGPRQPGLPDRFGGDAAQLARRAQERRGLHARGRGHRGRARSRDREPAMAHARPRRAVGDEGVRRAHRHAGRGGGERALAHIPVGLIQHSAPTCVNRRLDPPVHPSSLE